MSEKTIRAGATRLVYCDDSLPGLTRRKAGRGWAYFDSTGQRITDRDEIDRLNRIALPPAYSEAWDGPARTLASTTVRQTNCPDRGLEDGTEAASRVT